MSLTKTVGLKNKKGERLTLLLRPYREGEEERLIACVRDEYGETYFKRDFYRREYLQKKAREGVITFLVAETPEGEIAGMMILKEFYPQESMCEIASQIFCKKYRGYGLAFPFFEYGMEILLSRAYSAAYCLPVVFHSITQELLYRLGLRAAGFILNVFDMERITHSYQNGGNQKHSQAIQIMAVQKKDAGMLYLPEIHRGIGKNVYDSLDVSYELASAGASGLRSPKEIPRSCRLTYTNDERQKNLEIRIHTVGRDMQQGVEALLDQFPLKGKQTCNIFLNINDKGAPWAYHIWEKAGFFFAGFKPLCSQREYMVLHHPGEVEIYFGEYQVGIDFQLLLEYVESCYNNRVLP